MKYNSVFKLSFFCIFLLALASVSSAQRFDFKKGFNAGECDDLLYLNYTFMDTAGKGFDNYLDGYTFLHRSPSIGLDNMWDMWMRDDSTIVILLRGTTGNMMSILADFYCAMTPAQGTIKLSAGRSLDYQLAADPRAAVHSGFLIGFAFIADDMFPRLDSLYQRGYRKFIIAGHSQGGALCYYVSSWLYYLHANGVFPGLKVKTYASAAPKMGNMYYVYDYDNTQRSEWSFSIVNTVDPVPEMPFTTQQVDIDMNEPNPILNLEKRFDDLPFLKRIVMKRVFRRMKNDARKSSESYQKYLGDRIGKFIYKALPDVVLPKEIQTTYFLRPGVPITLSANGPYAELFKDKPNYYAHDINAYRFLLRQYYTGLKSLE